MWILFAICALQRLFLQSCRINKQNKLNKRFAERAHFIWLVMIKMPFLLLNGLDDVDCGRVGECVVRSITNKTDTDWPFCFIALSYCSGIGCQSRGKVFYGRCQDVSMFSHLLDDTL